MRALGFDVKKAEVLKILESSASQRGVLSQDEFTRTMTEYILQRDPLEEIRRAFQLFDDDGTGKISIKNLRRVAKELGEVLEEEELAAMIEVFLMRTIADNVRNLI
jgi:centrin-3